jgi:hypothetical protein
MRKAGYLILYGALVSGWVSSAAAQMVPLFQDGQVQPNEIAKFERNGAARNSGGIAGDNNGLGVTPFAATDFQQRGVCSNSGPASGPYNQICIGHDSAGDAVLSVDNLGGGTGQFKFLLNGILQTPTTGGPYLPTAGGVIVGTAPGSITVNRGLGAMPAPPLINGIPTFWAVGNNNENPAIVVDGIGNYGAIILRRANGNGNVAVAADDVLGQIAARGYGGTGYPGVGNARLQFLALGNFTDSAQGTKIILQTTAVGQAGSVRDQATIGPGVAVGAPTVPTGGMQYGDLNAQRVLIHGQPAVTATGVLTTAGGTVTGTAPGSLTVNRYTSLPTPATNAAPVFWGVGNANENPTFLMDGIGNHAALVLRRANGTGSSPVQAGDDIGHMAVRGYGATHYSDIGNPRLVFGALENFTDSAQGTKIELQTTAKGTAGSVVVQATVGPGLTIGPAIAPQGGTKLGDLNALRVLVNRNVAPPVAPVLQVDPFLWAVGNTGEHPATVIDGIGDYPVMMMRRANGAGASPIAAGETIGQIAVRGYGTTGYPSVGNARIVFNALETFTDSAQGTQILIQTTPLGLAGGVQPQATIGPGVKVGAPSDPLGGMQIGDLNAQRIFAAGSPAVVVTAGTKAGTCKLIAYTKEKTPTTLLDNVGAC